MKKKPSAESLFTVDHKKCISCYACIRECPVKAIGVTADSSVAVNMQERCIGCGNCIPACPTEAITYRSSIQAALELLDSGKRVVALLDPAIAAEFPDITDYRKFARMVKMLGAESVYEVSFGVDIIAQQYKDLFKSFKGKYYICANCPAISALIRKYHPDLLSNLATILPPVSATAVIARSEQGDDVSVLSISPCVAAKDFLPETPAEARVDCTITFSELRELFRIKSITESKLEYSDFDGPRGSLGALFPLPDGWLKAAGTEQTPTNQVISTISGASEANAAVKDFEQFGETIHQHLNLFHCNGCLDGPGMSVHGDLLRKKRYVIDYTKNRTSDLDSNEWQKSIHIWKPHISKTAYKADLVQKKINDPEKVQAILNLIGKEGTRGCAACGYNSCREFAEAVVLGHAKTEMCVNYTLRHRSEYISSLKESNDKLSQTQKLLSESEEKARNEKEAAREAAEILQAMLHKIPSAILIVDHQMKIVQSNQGFIQMLGQDAEEINQIIPGLTGADVKTLLPAPVCNILSYVLSNDEKVVNRDVNFGDHLLNLSAFSIHKGKIIGAVFRDLYTPEIREEEAIIRINEVIGKNLDMVQKIGFLLGEGAAETEQMLNSIIQSYKNIKHKGGQ
jgi:iron only hydrogenase large subunit-like protein